MHRLSGHLRGLRLPVSSCTGRASHQASPPAQFAANLVELLINNSCDLPTALLISAVIAAGNTLESLLG
jgi:hypothetical protein